MSYETAPQQLVSFKKRDSLIFEKPDGEPLSTGVHIMKNINELDPASSRLNHLMLMAERDELCRDERVFTEISSLIKSVTKKKMPLTDSLRRMIDSTSHSNEYQYTFHRFNRRYFSQGIYSPGRSFKYRNILTVAVDVSGSMVINPGDLQAAFGIIEDLLDRFRVFLLCIDETVFIPEKKGDMFTRSAGAEKPYEYKKGDWRFIKTGSNGTTYFESLFNRHMRGHKEQLIVITDGYIYDLDRLEKYHNTLWLISEERDEPFVPPFGKAVRIATSRPAGLCLNRNGSA
jgi:predicted metal-dependent peptidase